MRILTASCRPLRYRRSSALSEAFILFLMSSLCAIRSLRMPGSRPVRRSLLRNLAPLGETISPSSLSVVKQMFLLMMSDGYIDLKSSTMTQWYSPGSMVCTYPPSMASSSSSSWREVNGTPTGPNGAGTRSALRIRMESMSVELPEVCTSSIGSLDTAARSMVRRSESTCSRILSASSASLMQYFITLPESRSHSSSILDGSTSSFSSPRASLATWLRVSCLGRRAILAAHQASTTSRPVIFHPRWPVRRGSLRSLPHSGRSAPHTLARSSTVGMS